MIKPKKTQVAQNYNKEVLHNPKFQSPSSKLYSEGYEQPSFTLQSYIGAFISVQS